MFFEILFRKIPFEDKNLFKIQNDIIYNELRPTFPSTEELDFPQLADPLYKDFIVACWNTLPTVRPNFTQIIEFLKNIIKDIKVEEETFPPIEGN